jgi:hypothetical protein
MSQSTNYLELISEILKDDIQSELMKIRPSRGFDGQRKPVSGRYPTPLNNRIDTGRLYNSVTVDFVEDPQGQTRLRLSFPNAPEWRFVNYGRRGKKQNPALKYPPLDTITEWTIRRGLPQFRDSKGRYMRNKSTRELFLSRAFMVQRSIGQYGIYPTKFIDEGFKKSQERIVYYLGLYGRAILEDFIQKKIIIQTNPR